MIWNNLWDMISATIQIMILFYSDNLILLIISLIA